MCTDDIVHKCLQTWSCTKMSRQDYVCKCTTNAESDKVTHRKYMKISTDTDNVLRVAGSS